MRFLSRIAFALILLASVSCVKDAFGPGDDGYCYPEGTPVTMNISFGVPDMVDVSIATKAEASRADEARVRDLYVMLFDSQGDNFYSRYFTFEHQNNSLQNLDSNSSEGWYVENTDNSFGVVKIATQAKDNCTLVLLANVENAITSLNHRNSVDVLSQIRTLSALSDVRVTLEQEIVDRADLFLMMDTLQHVNTGALSWGVIENDVPNYNKPGGKFQLRLQPLDAKVKFWIKYNETNIDPAKSEARKWKVYNVPSECYLLPRADQPSDITFFDTQKAFFEGTDVTETYQVFSFYMLENRQEPESNISNLPSEDQSYYLREKEKNPSSEDPSFIYAPRYGTYVKFDLLLGLKTMGVQEILGDFSDVHALTTEAMYTVHLGQFGNSNPNDALHSPTHDWDNYDVERSTFYNYYITVNNSRSIYVEVLGEDGDPDTDNGKEVQAGQEGSLLLSTDGIVNCDAHYTYHSLTFRYTPGLDGKKVSWYVKTPFDEGGAQWIPDPGNANGGDWRFDCKDYMWVQFGLNEIDGSTYSKNRIPYPGNTHDSDWDPSTEDLAGNQLMDIHQLYNFILHQTKIRKEWEDGGSAGDDPSVFKPSGEADDPSTAIDENAQYVIRVTAFIDEYYYEKDPTLDPRTAPADPDLWRRFVNADPRELHILSEAHYSADGQSDVITSSHSIIQQSIQTFYNTYSPDLKTLWGTEHTDEMEYRIRHEKDNSQTPWPWWPSGRKVPYNASANSDENGRQNTAKLWGVDDTHHPYWADYESNSGMLEYSVDNDTPELKTDYQYLAYSCLTRNRDNNGNHVIDPDEVRWYIASVNQLVGMWVGNEALSPSARLYQPVDKNRTTGEEGLLWRSWVVSSTASSVTNPRVIRAEEGCTKSTYDSFTWAGFDATGRHQVSSVRCVRNIGTFNSGGVTTDISYADLSVIPDQYYESPASFTNDKVNPNNDGTYTLRFSRLDPRSIREFTSVDLPYTEEYSMQNRVYMELNMQDPTTPVTIPTRQGGWTAEEINDDITTSGHNTFCPTGYRMPNMTEMLLMTALLPSSYWSNKAYPCRTYYSRGVRGSKITTGTPSEAQKIGWGYDGGIFHMHNARAAGGSARLVTDMRCVRDNKCTGEITGSISVPGGDKLHMGDQSTIKLNITSLGSAIKTLNLYLVYVSSNGAEETLPIDIGNLKLSGVAIQDETVDWTVPNNLTLLGDMFVRAIVVNNVGTRKVLETPIRVLSPVTASVRLLPCVYDGTATPLFPVLLTVYSPDEDIDGWQLRIKDPDNETIPVNLSPVTNDKRYWNITWQYVYGLNTLMSGTYSFQLEVRTHDGKRTLSNIAQMDILRINYVPNPGHTGDEGYNKSSDVTIPWEPDVVTGMKMSAGDFIEANIDISNCSYYLVTDPATGERDNDETLGKDNIISIGITDTDHNTNVTVPYVYHIYYPAHDDDESADPQKDWLRPNISTALGKSNGTNYKRFKGGPGTGFKLQSGDFYMPDTAYPQLFRLERSGAFWNGQWIDPSLWNQDQANNPGNPADAAASLSRIIASDTFYIGSTQGTHRTRATYHFVRAVRNSAESNAAGGETGFDEDHPINGGPL